MYASFLNQLNNFVHYFWGFILVFIIISRFLFSKEDYSGVESFYAYFIKMVLLTIVLGYGLVILKLFEFIGIFLSLLVIYMIKNRNLRSELAQTYLKLTVFFSDYFDGKIKLIDNVKCIFIKLFKKSKKQAKKALGHNLSISNLSLFIIVFAYSAYIRFYDAIINAPPAMADGYVNLAWMKYILNRQLFHDGIYPQGFYIYLAMIQKFAYIDPLYILKYTGPLNAILIMFSIFFFLSKLTRKYSIGIIGASVYGFLGKPLPMDLMRQAASDGQEFGYVFILPTLYFAYKYLEEKEKKYLHMTFYGLNVIVLSHTIAYSFVVIGIIVLFLSALILNFKKYFTRAVKFIYIGFLSAVIGVIPIAIGFAYGKGFHGSSADFMLQKMKFKYPPLNMLNYLGIGCIVLIFIYVAIRAITAHLKLSELYVLFLSIAAVSIFYYGGVITQNVVVESRFREFWAIIMPICIGFAVFILSKIMIKDRLINIFQRLAAIILIITIIFLVRPKPIIPYKMDRNEAVEQYIRFSKKLRPTEWIMISHEQGYPVAYGRGYHLMMNDFLELYNPLDKTLMRKDTKEELKIPDIFIYNEKEVFRTDFENLQAIYDKKEVENELLNNWVEDYKKHHDNLSIFYEDENLVIYRIKQKLSRETLLDNIWGGD